MDAPAAELTVSPAQVAALVRDQVPELAGGAVVPVAGGAMNTIFRIGAGSTARFPRRYDEPHLVRARLVREAEAAAEFRTCSAFPAPQPQHLGRPGSGYPLPWSVQSWIDGEPATSTSCQDSVGLAHDLARLLCGLRAADTRGRRFSGPGGEGDFTHNDPWMEECLRRGEGLVDTAAVRRLWQRLRVLPREDPDAMCHTDLIPSNLLVAGGRLEGVLDTGGFQPADPAYDLVCAWHLLEPGPREALRTELGCSDLQWARGMAWALQQAAGPVWASRRDDPERSRMGRTTIARLLAA